MLERKVLFISLFALAAFALAACSDSKSIPEANTVASLGEALDAAGMDVDGPLENGVLSSRFFSVPGMKFEAGDETVLAYEFDSEAAATEDRALVSVDGWGIGSKYINWTVTPNYYHNGKLIVIYDGDDPEVTETLTAAMGERFNNPEG